MTTTWRAKAANGPVVVDDDGFSERAKELACQCADLLRGEPIDLVAAVAGNLIVSVVDLVPEQRRARFLLTWMSCVMDNCGIDDDE